jgi:dsDNA-specific endonuclease/ATPase MutS2
MADIGDLQSVDGDLSTFSGHLVMCREMLRTINTRRSSDDDVEEGEESSRSDSGGSGTSTGGNIENDGLKKPYFLILLDEIGTGTDPNQV